MPDFSISKEEWKIAHQYLDNADDGTKLPYTYLANANNELIPRQKKNLNPASYKTTHSFIKLSGNIYALAQGESSILGCPEEDPVKYVKNEDGTMMVIKITKRNGDDEAMIMADLAISPASGKRKHSSKHYAVMTYLGTNLNNYLISNSKALTEEQRLDIAIKLCWQVHRLHSGQAALSHAQYAHMDLKPNNVTVDESGEVHLIDFGLALRSPQKTGGSETCAYLWVAYNSENQALTRERYDIVALQRILFMPKSMYCSKGFVNSIEPSYQACVLTESQLQKMGLNQYINTHADCDNPPDYSKDTTTAATLTALLIAEKLKLNIDHAKIVNNPHIAAVIAELYFSNKSNEIIKIITNDKQVRLASALCSANKLDQLQKYKNDGELNKILRKSASKTVDVALIHLKDQRLRQHYNAVIESPDMAENIVELARENLGKYIKILFEDDIKLKAISILRKTRFGYYNHVRSQALYSASKAISFDPNMVSTYYQTVIKSTSLADTIVRYEKLSQGIDPSVFFTLVKTPKLRKAIHLLFKFGVSDKNFIDYVITDYHDDCSSKKIASLIVTLAQLNLSAIYPKLVADQKLTGTISLILNCEFKNTLTADMLENKLTRDILDKYVRRHPEKYQGFLALHKAGAFNSPVDLPEIDTIYFPMYGDMLQPNPVYYLINAACLLNQKFSGKTLASYLKFIADSQDNARYIYKILVTDDPTESISKTELLIKILRRFAPENRLKIILDFCSADDLKEMHKSILNWREFKSLLPNDDDKKVINKLIYSKDQLAAKTVLRNIKHEIRDTNWPADKTTGTYSFQGKMISAPSLVGKHMGALHYVTMREKTHIEALETIKQIGKQEAQNPSKLILSIKQTLFGKSTTEKYIDKFRNEETFNAAFVKRPPG